MRTVKRVSVKLNKKKFQDLIEIANAYAKEKQIHLNYYQTDNNFAFDRNSWNYRNKLSAEKYQSQFGLQKKMVNCAIKDAYETELKYWAAISEDVKSTLFNLEWTDTQRHYGFWLLKIPQRLATLICSKAPINPKIELSLEERKQVQNYLRRVIRRKYKNRPKIISVRSFACDGQMYRLDNLCPQILFISSKEADKRIKIPLKGFGEINGEIRIILDVENRVLNIHLCQDVNLRSTLSLVDAGIDLGITEIFIDDKGNKYGEELGKMLTNRSEYTKERSKPRNKLHKVRRSYLKIRNFKKARNIQKYNLGKKKLNKKKFKFTETCKRIVNTSINQLVKLRKPATIAVEKLDFRGKAQNRDMSRKVSLWPRSILKERLEFKASVKGFNRKYVNSMYTSQTCSTCGYLDKENRHGDKFHCLKCGQVMCADWNAAINCKLRLYDSQITLGMSMVKVKRVLQDRYNARLEIPNASETMVSDMFRKDTVSGQTLNDS